ncbi:MAG TPA: ABC transporter substrate-binding protein [Acidimicrobiales bacterium]|nr:ABC transporter substrate-binding protein [Acidimicrobiales bacterium]
MAARALPARAVAAAAGAAAAAAGALVAGVLLAGVLVAGPAAAAATLSGVTLNVADQFKEYQTIFNATGALKGAKYKVNWSEFTDGTHIIAAEAGGSVDLGDMAETPTIFAQAAGDPVKVVATTVGASPKASPFGLLVPAGSSATEVAQLRGKSIAVQVGTVEQYLLIQMLQRAKVPYGTVHIDNLTVVNGSAAVQSGQVDGYLGVQPLISLDVQSGKARVLQSAAGYGMLLGYLTASQAALDNPKKKAAIADFVQRFYKAGDYLRNHRQLAAQTYVETYGVSPAVARAAVASVQVKGSPLTKKIVAYQQKEADTFLKLGLLSTKLDVAKVFTLPFNRQISKAAGLTG